MSGVGGFVYVCCFYVSNVKVHRVRRDRKRAGHLCEREHLEISLYIVYIYEYIRGLRVVSGG